MAAMNNIKIQFELESIVKVLCVNYDCVYNLYKRGYNACNLKCIEINSEGMCNEYNKLKLNEKNKSGGN